MALLSSEMRDHYSQRLYTLPLFPSPTLLLQSPLYSLRYPWEIIRVITVWDKWECVCVCVSLHRCMCEQHGYHLEWNCFFPHSCIIASPSVCVCVCVRVFFVNVWVCFQPSWKAARCCVTTLLLTARGVKHNYGGMLFFHVSLSRAARSCSLAPKETFTRAHALIRICWFASVGLFFMCSFQSYSTQTHTHLNSIEFSSCCIKFLHKLRCVFHIFVFRIHLFLSWNIMKLLYNFKETIKTKTSIFQIHIDWSVYYAWLLSCDWSLARGRV